jgi:glucan 1,3-beta-glucosidase
MENHLRTWLTEKDFQEISSLGFSSLRLPVGYWNIIPDPYKVSAPKRLSLSHFYINWAFQMAEKYNLSIILDLHGAPQSQNGIDHSGCNTVLKFPEPQNVNLSLLTIEEMMKKYSSRKSFLGIELLNEPALHLASEQHNLLVSFYERAYRIIRSYHKTCLVLINELYERNWKKWSNALQEPQFYNVVMDYHLYNWQNPYTFQTSQQHLENARNWEDWIEAFTSQHPVIVGEWCMSTGTVLQVGQPFVDECTRSFQKSFGYYLWNWKIDRKNSGDLYSYWDVQFQMITLGKEKNGLNPLKLFP